MLKVYVCGPTVYGPPHIGNFRPIITFDIYIRSLLKLGKKVHLTHNITDIDDKIIAYAGTNKTTEEAVANRFLKIYRNLLKKFNITTINELPLVTKNLDQIINFITKLVNKKKAYEIKGNVFFDVTKAKAYGIVSNQNLKKIIPNKVHPLARSKNDFVLWKKTNQGIQFDSPWGKGRPGWHTECAALVAKTYNGQQLDIHGGGVDLIFPHHENENAQFQVLFNKELTRQWKHIGHLNFQAIKMSKSKGNTIDAQTFIKTYGADVLRMIFLASSPTKPLTIKKSLIDNAFRNLDKLQRAYIQAQLLGAQPNFKKVLLEPLVNWEFSHFAFLLFNQVKQFNLDKNLMIGGIIIDLVQMLGFNFAKNIISKTDKKLYKQWQMHQKQGDYKVADELRDQLQKKRLI